MNKFLRKWTWFKNFAWAKFSFAQVNNWFARASDSCRMNELFCLILNCLMKKLHTSKKRKFLVYFTQAGYIFFKQNCDKKVVICKILQKNKEKWIFMFFTSSNDQNNILKVMSLNKWSFKCAFSMVSSSFINKHSNSFSFFSFFLLLSCTQ